jgi:TonB family protein
MCHAYRGQTICRPGGGVSPPKLVQPAVQPILDAKSNDLKCPCKVWLDAIINKNGRVSESRVLFRSEHPDLDQRALAEVKKWQFQPAQLLGSPVAVEIDFEVDFR